MHFMECKKYFVLLLVNVAVIFFMMSMTIPIYYYLRPSSRHLVCFTSRSQACLWIKHLPQLLNFLCLCLCLWRSWPSPARSLQWTWKPLRVWPTLGHRKEDSTAARSCNPLQESQSSASSAPRWHLRIKICFPVSALHPPPIQRERKETLTKMIWWIFHNNGGPLWTGNQRICKFKSNLTALCCRKWETLLCYPRKVWWVLSTIQRTEM